MPREPWHFPRADLAARIAFAALLLLLPVRTAGAAEALPEGTYLSLDDARLADEGHIVPILEYVEIGRAEDGTPSLETGYLHLVPDPLLLLQQSFGHAMSRQGPGTIRVDLAGMRRVALTAEAEVGEERIAWTARTFARTSHEPGRLAPADEPRLSPFLLATAAAKGGAKAPSLRFALNGDVLAVTGPDGAAHLYRREPPMVARLAGFIGYDQGMIIAPLDECLRPLTEALAHDRTYAFTHAARDAARAAAAADGAAARAAWQLMEAKGLGVALAHYLDATVEAQQEAGRFLGALVDRESLDAILDPSGDPAGGFDPAEAWALKLTAQFHYFGPQAGERAPAVDDTAALLAAMKARYARDPWSVTGPAAMQLIDKDGWVAQVRRLLHEEIARLCPAAAGP